MSTHVSGRSQQLRIIFDSSSSAQIVEHYQPEALVGRQVVAVVNFSPRQIGKVLTLGFPDADGEVGLFAPDQKIPDGGRSSRRKNIPTFHTLLSLPGLTGNRFNSAASGKAAWVRGSSPRTTSPKLLASASVSWACQEKAGFHAVTSFLGAVGYPVFLSAIQCEAQDQDAGRCPEECRLIGQIVGKPSPGFDRHAGIRVQHEAGHVTYRRPIGRSDQAPAHPPSHKLAMQVAEHVEMQPPRNA
jgi:hypothetical protein